MIFKPTLNTARQRSGRQDHSLALAELAPVPMAIVEGSAHLLGDVNPAFCRLLNRSRDDLVGKAIFGLLPENDACMTLLERVYRTGKPECHTEEESNPHGKFWSYTLWPLRADERVVGVVMLVTQSATYHEQLVAMNEALLLGSVRQHELVEAAKKLNGQLQAQIAERQDLETQLRQAQKMEAVGQLTGGIAHDFNNILTVITSYSELLLEALSADDPKRESLNGLREATDQATALTRQLLAFSRRTILEPMVLDLNAVILKDETMFRRLLGENLVLSLVLERVLRHVKVDPSHLDQVLMNLAVNARDAMPQGGKLTIETTNIDLQAADRRLRLEMKAGPYVLLAITDTGCGMTSDVQSHIFEPFFTTKGVGQGTGLGLAVVYGIIKQSGGHIEVQSTPGAGTTFRILFPAVADPLAVLQETQAAKHQGGSETILLAEDDSLLRKLAALALQDQGYTLLLAADGKDALRLLESHAGPIDLLATDIMMPHLGGPELASALRPRYPHMKVLFLSGYTNDDVLLKGSMGENDAFLQKPYTPSALRMKVRQVLDHGRGRTLHPHAVA
jgi:signal transduction histidine kinase